MGTASRKPCVRYRVLATDWEGESFTECWTENLESAQTIAAALKRGDVTVQIDAVKTADSVKAL